jgi:hypothetical protein
MLVPQRSLPTGRSMLSVELGVPLASALAARSEATLATNRLEAKGALALRLIYFFGRLAFLATPRPWLGRYFYKNAGTSSEIKTYGLSCKEFVGILCIRRAHVTVFNSSVSERIVLLVSTRSRQPSSHCGAIMINVERFSLRSLWRQLLANFEQDDLEDAMEIIPAIRSHPQYTPAHGPWFEDLLSNLLCDSLQNGNMEWATYLLSRGAQVMKEAAGHAMCRGFSDDEKLELLDAFYKNGWDVDSTDEENIPIFWYGPTFYFISNAPPKPPGIPSACPRCNLRTRLAHTQSYTAMPRTKSS